MGNLAKTLAEARQGKGLSLREVADLAGVSYQTVCNAERGKAKLSTAGKIARALGIPQAGALRAAQRDVATYLLTA